jgi:hypothetical protein
MLFQFFISYIFRGGIVFYIKYLYNNSNTDKNNFKIEDIAGFILSFIFFLKNVKKITSEKLQ